jgi:preprotein translocase subunit YajC
MSKKRMVAIGGLVGTITKITENYVILSMHGAVNFGDFSPYIKIMKRDDSYVWDKLEENGVDINEIMTFED